MSKYLKSSDLNQVLTEARRDLKTAVLKLQGAIRTGDDEAIGRHEQDVRRWEAFIGRLLGDGEREVTE